MHKPTFGRVYATRGHCRTGLARIDTTVDVFMAVMFLVAGRDSIGLGTAASILRSTAEDCSQLIRMLHMNCVHVVRPEWCLAENWAAFFSCSAERSEASQVQIG